MTPTTRFRYVEREVRIYICDGIARCEHHKILQQWWGIEEDHTVGEWRDVPLENEA